MAQIDNSSAGVLKLRNSLNQSIGNLKQTYQQSGKLVVDIHSTWSDHQYEAFKEDFDKGTETVILLFKKMEEFDKKLLDLQAKLKHYEDLKLKSAFRR